MVFDHAYDRIEDQLGRGGCGDQLVDAQLPLGEVLGSEVVAGVDGWRRIETHRYVARERSRSNGVEDGGDANWCAVGSVDTDPAADFLAGAVTSEVDMAFEELDVIAGQKRCEGLARQLLDATAQHVRRPLADRDDPVVGSENDKASGHAANDRSRGIRVTHRVVCRAVGGNHYFSCRPPDAIRVRTGALCEVEPTGKAYEFGICSYYKLFGSESLIFCKIESKFPVWLVLEWLLLSLCAVPE